MFVHAICTCVTFVAVFMHERAYELMVRISHRTTHRIAQLPLFAQTQARCQSLLAVISTLYLCATAEATTSFGTPEHGWYMRPVGMPTWWTLGSCRAAGKGLHS